MLKIPLGMETYQRRVGDEPHIRFVNRFLEADPTDQVDGVAALRRPGMRQRIQSGDGPIRRVFTQSGFAENDAFIFSKNQLLRLHYTPTEGDTQTLLDGFIYGSGTPSVCARDDYMFIADGVVLQQTDGSSDVTPITVPDDQVIISVCAIKQHIICLVQNSARFYWIEPGQITIDPLNFATFESQPDIAVEVQSIGDQFWGFGQDSTEPWYFTGDPDAPVAPIQGRPFNYGAWGGTAVELDNEVLLVGSDGRVYSVAGQATPISTPGIEERIARAMKIQLQDL